MSSNLQKLVQATARISSRNRTLGTPNNFSLFLTPQIDRAVAFVVKSCYVINSWYNITSSNNISYWNVTGPSPQAIYKLPVPEGQYEATDLASVMGTMLQDHFGGTVSFIYLPRLNKFQFSYNNGANALGFLTTDSGIPGVGTEGTINANLGFTTNQSSTANGNVVGNNMINLLDYPTIAIGSPQMRKPISIDSRSTGGNNCFLHLHNDVPKNTPIRYQNYAPSPDSFVRYPGPQMFSYLTLNITNPDTGLPIDVFYDWEIIVTFMILAP